MTATTHSPGREARPALITDAKLSPQQEYKLRRRRYDLLMAGRVVCVIGAFVVGSVFSNVWLAGLFIAAAAVLPWAAVLIANDRLPTAAAARRTQPAAAAGTATPIAAASPVTDHAGHRVLEG